MKNIVLAVCALLICSQASAKKVKFSVDMTGVPLDTTGMHIGGDFQLLAGYTEGDWISNSTDLVQEGSSDIWSIVVDIPAFRKYEYKFLNGDQWYNAEFVPEFARVGYNGNDNRWIYVDSTANDTTYTGLILFGGNAPAGQLLARMFVDMQFEPNVDTLKVRVAGSFQAWVATGTTMYSFVPGVFEVIAHVNPGTTYYYFLMGDELTDTETIPAECNTGDNRTLTTTTDTVLGTVCFSSCGLCNVGVDEAASVPSFSVYPNPTTDRITIDFGHGGTASDVAVIDAMGRTVYSIYAFGADRLNVDLSQLGSGVYHVRVSQPTKGQLSTSRLVVQ